MPSRTFVTDWLREDKDFADQYARAREDLLEHWADQIVAIADDSSCDWETRKRENGEEYEVANPEVVNRARLRVDTRKWLMSKLAPRKYGDKVEHTGANGGPVVITWLPPPVA